MLIGEEEASEVGACGDSVGRCSPMVRLERREPGLVVLPDDEREHREEPARVKRLGAAKQRACSADSMK